MNSGFSIYGGHNVVRFGAFPLTVIEYLTVFALLGSARHKATLAIALKFIKR